jgi:hypothetical protein
LNSSTLHTPELSVDIKPTGNSGQLAKPVQINLQSLFRSTYLAIQVTLQSQFRSTYLAIQVNLQSQFRSTYLAIQVNLLGNSDQLTWQMSALTLQMVAVHWPALTVDEESK